MYALANGDDRDAVESGIAKQIESIVEAARWVTEYDKLIKKAGDNAPQAEKLRVMRGQQEKLLDTIIASFADQGGVNYTLHYETTDDHNNKVTRRSSPLIEALKYSFLGVESAKLLLKKGAKVGAGIGTEHQSNVVPFEFTLVHPDHADLFAEMLDTYMAQNPGKRPDAIKLLTAIGEQREFYKQDASRDEVKDASAMIDIIVTKLGPVDIKAAIEGGQINVETHNLSFVKSLLAHCPEKPNLDAMIVQELSDSFLEQHGTPWNNLQRSEVLTFLIEQSGITHEHFNELAQKAHEKYKTELKERAAKDHSHEEPMSDGTKGALNELFAKAAKNRETTAPATPAVAAAQPENIAPFPADKATPSAPPVAGTPSQAPDNIVKMPAATTNVAPANLAKVI